MVTFTDDGIRFSSGREVYAHDRIIGLEADGKGDLLGFSEGYDGGISVDPRGCGWNVLSVADAIELCDVMVEAWQKRKADLIAWKRQS